MTAADVQTRIAQLLATIDDSPDDLMNSQNADPLLTHLPTFVRGYYAAAQPEYLDAQSPETLLAVARSHLQLAAEREAGQVKVSVQPALNTPAQDSVYTVTQDMPFLVDTVSLAARESGGGIDWLLHPVMRLRRDARGELQEVLGTAGNEDDGDEESLIHIQFDALDPARRDALAQRLERNLNDLRVVVQDWQAMRRQIQSIISEFDRVPCGVGADECAEVQAFLRWLADDHFTFLGYRKRSVDATDEVMNNDPGTSLGLLREDLPGLDPDGYVAPAAEIDKYALSARLLVVTKANTRAWIHHAEQMDVIAIKRLDDAGNVIGAHRLLGLFSSEAYASSPRDIPVLRRKVSEITARAALRPGSHSAKTLRYVLETFPRDELFQSSEEELFDTALGVVALRESQRLRLFLRRDRYGRFFSALIYVPRERYSLALRQQLAGLLSQDLGGEQQESSAQFLRGALVRIHVIVATSAGSEIPQSVAEIEANLLAATRTWRDGFSEALHRLHNGAQEQGQGQDLKAEYSDAFSTAYREHVNADEAVADAQFLAGLADDQPKMRLLSNAQSGQLRLKIYGRGEETPLAAILPVLQNFGLQVQTQRPFHLRTASGAAPWIHEFVATHADAPDAQTHAEHIQTAFSKTWQGLAENDGLNCLVIGAGLDWRRVALVRTITRYLLQTQLPYSQNYVERLLAEQSPLVVQLVALFFVRFNPSMEGDRDRRTTELLQAIDHGLDSVVSLDADRVLRSVLGVIQASLRTNYFQTDEAGDPKPYISLKMESSRVPELPLPLPLYEAFVYSPQVEGVHLRGGKVARGGLRWSDRREDFRTEVLGLMKAQMVKNAVIVPVGAKGGFVVKNAPAGEDRDARQKRGIACYQTFIRGLLDITDNNVGETVVAPPNVIRHDEDDPYLVVAADKGTASFSDIANALSQEYGFWLDDAFASGGSAGYDHKVMGITARGAWEGVKRHFRELEHDTQSQDFTVVGVGDMAGDVFGNGMLLSRHIKLLAAFNHLHIFIDPNPESEASFVERERLFKLPRSAWTDYDASLISEGGGIYSRSDKVIELSEAARKALGISQAKLAPAELIHELLKAPADLLWNGGIGTYVKSSLEGHADVGDRANDTVRVDGRDLRCKVIGEGGNLGLTQAGRIEFARNGGHLNTDAIDNSGGVDSSDMEVNIKIALNQAMASGALSRESRNTLLVQMTDGVIDLVLRTNYLQTQLISVLEGDAPQRLDEHVNLMRTLERDGLLDRQIEGLPDEEDIEDRARNNQGLTRPELAVLVSYTKISLLSAVLDSELPAESYLESVLLEGFPEPMRDHHMGELQTHRLRREIIATLITNQMVDRMGIAVAHRLASESGVPLAAVVRAFVLATEMFDAENLWAQIEALDNQITTDQQYRLIKVVVGLIKHAIGWICTRAQDDASIQEWIDGYRDSARRLLEQLPELLSGQYQKQWQKEQSQLTEIGIPADLAKRLAAVHNAGGALDILLLSQLHETDLDTIATLYFEVGAWLNLPWLLNAIQNLEAEGRWQALARASLRDDCYLAHQRIVADVLTDSAQSADSAKARIKTWRASRGPLVDFVRSRMKELQSGESYGFAQLSVAVRDLGRLVAQ